MTTGTASPRLWTVVPGEIEVRYSPPYADPLHARMYEALLERWPSDALEELLEDVPQDEALRALDTMHPPHRQETHRSRQPLWGAVTVVRHRLRTTIEPTEPEPTMSEDSLLHIAPSAALPWPNLNRRRRFDRERLDELKKSIANDGLLEPLLVTEAKGKGADVEDDVTHLVVAGERRWRAARELEGESKGPDVEIPVLVRDIPYELAVKLVAVENIQRENMTAMEEAWQLQAWREAEPELTQEEMAEELGFSQSWVANRLRLLRLTPALQDAVQEGRITASQARDLILPFTALRDDDVRELLFEAVGERIGGMKRGAGAFPLAPDELEKLVGKEARALSKPLLGGWDFREQKDDPEKALFDPRQHETCDCGGVEYKYGDAASLTHGKSRRCFDIEWWQKRQEKARAKLDDEKEEALAEIHAGDPTHLHPKNVDDALTADSRRNSHDHLVWVGPIGDGGRGASLCDPRELDAESLLIAESYNPGHVRVFTTDHEALEVAREVAREVAEERYRAEVEALTRARYQRDRDVVQEVTGDAEALARLYRRGIAGLCGTQGLLKILHSLVDAAELEKLDIERINHMHRHEELLEEVLAWGEERSDDEILGLMHVALLRAGRGEYGGHWWSSPEKDEIVKILRAEYTGHLLSMFPFEIPEIQEDQEAEDAAEDEGMEGSVDDEADDDDVEGGEA